MIKVLSNRKFTTLWIDGNHENFDILNEYPVTSWNGGFVHKITDSVIHLMRGQVFNIQGKKFFTFGGARSEDREYRVRNVSWWEEEIPNCAEMETGLASLDKYNNKVDFILSHTCSLSTLQYIAAIEGFKVYGIDVTTKYLQHIKENIKYDKWLFGHFHVDYSIDDKEIAVYDKFIKLID